MKKLFYSLLTVGALTMTSCDKDVFNIGKDSAEGVAFPMDGTMPLSDRLANDSLNRYSEYVTVLKASGLYNAFNQSTKGVMFTAFAPNNDAMAEFEGRLGRKVTDMGEDYMKSFVLYHTLNEAIYTDKFLVTKSVTNMTKDVVSIMVDTENPGEVILKNNNSEGRVIHLADSVSNGAVYMLSRALTPLVETLYDRISKNANLSIIKDAIDEAGWGNRLSTIADTAYVNGKPVISNHNYTILAVDNDVFAKSGIRNVQDLKQKLQEEAKDQSITADSLLRQYVGYHILNSKQTAANIGAVQGENLRHVWSTSADNVVFTVDNDTLVKEDAEDFNISKKYTFNADSPSPVHFLTADVLALNGYVHTLDGYMPVYEPEQEMVVWDFVDNDEVRSIVTEAGVEYQPEVAPKSQTKTDIAKAPSFMGYKANDKANTTYSDVMYVVPTAVVAAAIKVGAQELKNNDCLVYNVGNSGSATLRTPTIVRGKYKVTLNVYYTTTHANFRTKKEGTGGMLEINFDGKNNKYVAPYTQVQTIPTTQADGSLKYPVPLPGAYTTTLYEEIEFTETSTHEFTFVVKDPSASTNKNFSLMFDTMTFTPIK